MGYWVRLKRTDSHAEPVPVVGSVRVGFGKINELGGPRSSRRTRPRLRGRLQSPHSEFLLPFPRSERERERGVCGCVSGRGSEIWSEKESLKSEGVVKF